MPPSGCCWSNLERGQAEPGVGTHVSGPPGTWQQRDGWGRAGRRVPSVAVCAHRWRNEGQAGSPLLQGAGVSSALGGGVPAASRGHPASLALTQAHDKTLSRHFQKG